MSNNERGFFVSEELATTVYRGLYTGSGYTTGKNLEGDPRRNLRSRLGIDNRSTSSPKGAIVGSLLVAYVTTSTHLIGLLEGANPETIGEQILKHLRVGQDITEREAFDGLMEAAMENSQKLDYHETPYSYHPGIYKDTSFPEEVVTEMLLMAYVISSTGLIETLKGTDSETIRDQISGHLLFGLDKTDQEAFEGLLEVAMENSQRLAFRHHPKPAE